MKDKYGDSGGSTFDYTQTQDGSSNKYILSRHDFELFDEAKAVPNKIIRIKRMGSAAKNERWRIIEDDELKFVVEGEKLSKKECAFLRTVEGIKFLISEYKLGFSSFSELKSKLKAKV